MKSLCQKINFEVQIFAKYPRFAFGRLLLLLLLLFLIFFLNNERILLTTMLTIKILFTINSLEKKKKLFIQNTIYNS